MPDWTEVSVDSYRGAGALFRDNRWRSVVSRAYYAAFSAVTAQLVGRIVFPPGYETPPHRDVPRLIELHFDRLSVTARREVRSIVRRLYNLRLMADYRLGLTTDQATARRCLADVEALYRKLEVAHD